MDDCTEWLELCQLEGSSVIVVSDGPEGRGADLLVRLDLSPPFEPELDFRGWIGELFGDGVDKRSGCSIGCTC